jgi:hypothetical protein
LDTAFHKRTPVDKEKEKVNRAPAGCARLPIKLLFPGGAKQQLELLTVRRRACVGIPRMGEFQKFFSGNMGSVSA